LSLLLLYTIIRCVYLQLSYLDVFFLVFAYPSYLPSFPTRRSSDLSLGAVVLREPMGHRALPRHGRRARETLRAVPQCGRVQAVRSEEHTSELQSRVDLVCRLLLEKKKTSTM